VLAAVVGELQVGLGLPGVHVLPALVADRHVHHRARHVALARIPRFERAAVAVRTLHPVRVARAAATAAAAVGLGGARAAVAGRRAVGVGLVAAVAVVVGVGEVKHVGVGVRRVGQAQVAGGRAEAQRVGPAVLAVVGQPGAGAGAIAALGVAAVAVGIEDVVRVGRVLVGDFQDRPGAGAAAAVRV